MKKVNMQIGYMPGADDISAKALQMLESADRKKSTLVALALSEFQERYGFNITSKAEIHSVITNYDFLRRTTRPAFAGATEIAAPMPVFEKKVTSVPKKKKEPEIGQEEDVTEEQRLAMGKIQSLFNL